MSFLPASVQLTNFSKLDTLVENRSVYTLDHCELNIYETYHASENVTLTFNDFVFTSMLKGKKVMHLDGKDAFDYLPGESVIAPPGETMCIDFPEASIDNPTQCIALCISPALISDTMQFMNEHSPRAECNDEWRITDEQFYLFNSQELAGAISKIVGFALQKDGMKDALASLALRELLIRLMQTQARKLFEENHHTLQTSHRFAFIISYIKQNLCEPITVDKLAGMACMSKPNFYRCFKRELGISPIEYVLRERIRFAKQLLSEERMSVTDVAYNAGFSNPNYFIRTFKSLEGVTPKHYSKAAHSQLFRSYRP